MKKTHSILFLQWVSLASLSVILSSCAPKLSEDVWTDDSGVWKSFYQQVYDTHFATLSTMSDVKTKIESLFSDYELEFAYEEPPLTPGNVSTHDVTFGNLTDADIELGRKIAAIITYALQKYPSSYISRSSLRKITIGKDLRHNNAKLGGVAYLAEGVFYLNAELYADRAQNEGTVHHELFHLFDWSNPSNASEWTALNPPDFTFGESGFKCIETGMPELVPGFVTDYAMCALPEDKAETFSYLMSQKLAAELYFRSPDDQRLKSKATYIKEFAKSIVPEMDPAFFENISQSYVPDIRGKSGTSSSSHGIIR